MPDINSLEELFTVPEGEEAERILSIPLNISVAVSVVGVAVAPLTFLPAMISAIGFDCHIELEKKDGTVMDVTNGVASAIVDASGYSDRN